jgi:hypothetical protein
VTQLGVARSSQIASWREVVRSATFALFGEVVGEMCSEDVYDLHCCWELEMRRRKAVGGGRAEAAQQRYF